MVEWRQTKDTKAEMAVLKCIAAREVLLEQIRQEATRSSKQYFNDSEHAGVQEQHVRLLLTLLDRLRLVTVQTCEAISSWRIAAEHQAKLREGEFNLFSIYFCAKIINKTIPPHPIPSHHQTPKLEENKSGLFQLL